MLDSQKHFDKVSSCHPPSGLIVEYDPLAGKYFYRCAECMQQCLSASDEKLQFNQTFRADRNVRKGAYTGKAIMWKSEDADLGPEAVIAGSEAMDETPCNKPCVFVPDEGLEEKNALGEKFTAHCKDCKLPTINCECPCICNFRNEHRHFSQRTCEHCSPSVNTEMGKEEWQKIFERLRYWEQKDNDWQEAMNLFCLKIAPYEYTPILERCGVKGFLDGFCQNNKELREELEYVLWEVPSLKREATVTRKGEKWNFKKNEDVIDYFSKFYPFNNIHEKTL